MQRILNSTVPFSHMAQNNIKSLNGSPPSHSESKEGVVGKIQQLTSEILLKAICQGTAKHEWMSPHGTEKPSIIAQAVCESVDSQEFCPNSSHKNGLPVGVSSPSLLGSVSRGRPRKKRRKRQRRMQGENESQQRVEASESAGVRRLTRVPEQDSGECQSSLIQVRDSVCISSNSSYSSSALSTERVSVQETAGPSSSYHWESQHTSLPDLSCQSYAQVSETECPLAVTALRGYVTTEDPCFAHGFFKDVLREDQERDEDEEREESDKNEGILFKKGLQPQNYEYREGREYERCKFLKQGSFGEVYSIKDKCTGFMCAAKKVPLVSFSSEEVGSWSALQSPQVVELFGVVREGPSIILFMDLKSRSLGQMVEERGRLPEDLSLHYYQQVLVALVHLHKRRVLHLDIKADNILLSEDGKDAFLCDFGQSERLDKQGLSFGQGLKGTETHMAPEVVLNVPRSSKADVWSSCCMLLHMLNGCHPWTRYYSRPLCLKIAEEPPPLREIPPDCSVYTADVIKAGLQKDPVKRASAKDLIVKTAKALKAVGGLRSPVRGGTYQKPLGKPENPDPAHLTTPTTSHYTTTSLSSELQWMSSEQKRSGEEDDEKPVEVKQWKQTEEEREDEDHSLPETLLHIQTTSPEPRLIHKTEPAPTVPEQELWRLERDFYLSRLSQPHSAEIQEQLLSCLSSDCFSTRENWDKKDSGRWSVGPGDDLSSGVFSYNSQQDGQSFSRDWLVPAHQPPPRCFEGVDVYIRDFDGKCFHIRETPRVKVGHIARGISDQISESVFSLMMEDGCLVSHDKEVVENSLFLRCVPAPNCSHCHQYTCCGTLAPGCKLPWSWRIREGVLETRD